MSNAKVMRGEFGNRSARSGLQVLLAGTDIARMQKIKERLPASYKVHLWRLVSSALPASIHCDAIVLLGPFVDHHLALVKRMAGQQIPVIGYELAGGVNERVKARESGVISLVDASSQEAELVAAIETSVARLPERKVQSTQETQFEKELSTTLKHLLRTQPSFGIREVCQRMQLSYSTLYRKTQKVYKRPPNRLIAAYRSKRAAELLLEGKLNITEIAYTCGFSSATYFARTFRQFYGLTPGQFKKGNPLA